MARRALEPGERGSIGTRRVPGGWKASVRVCDPDGVVRRVQAVAPARRDAEVELASRLTRRKAGQKSAISSETTLGELVALYLDGLGKRQLAPSTIALYSRAAWLIAPELRPADATGRRAKHSESRYNRRQAFEGLSRLKVRQLGVQGIEQFLDRVQQHSGAVRAKHCRVVLKASVAVAVKNGAMSYNLVRETDAVRIATPEVRALTSDECRALLADLRADPLAVAADLPGVAELLLVTGLRTGELLALRWRDVDLGSSPATITVSGIVTREEGLARRVERVKTRTSVRTLEIPATVANSLLSRQVAGASEYVLPSAVGGVRDPGNLRRDWRAFTGRHPRWDWTTLRTGRKTTASRVRDALGIEQASWQLGHSGVQITERHYAERVRRGPAVAALMEALLSGPSTEQNGNMTGNPEPVDPTA